MSHYTVMVHVTAAQLAAAHGNLEAALAEKMEPFNEQPDEGSPYLVFDDETAEYQREYAEEGCEMAREVATGKLLHTWDDRFRKPGTFGTGSDTHEVPEDGRYVVAEIPHRERFEEFVKDCHGSEPEDDGRYGHHRNPNAKWDWFQVGGRWRGHFPIKSSVEPLIGEVGNNPTPGCSDVVRFSDIDLDACARTEREDFKKFVGEYRDYLKGKHFDAFDGPRSTMFRLGLIRVENEPYTAKAGEIAKPWMGQPGVRQEPNVDVILDLSDTDLEKFSPFFSPLRTYAVLDGAGEWHAPGDMGWFGCSSDNAETNLAYSNNFFEKFVKPIGADDLLVMVDCHI